MAVRLTSKLIRVWLVLGAFWILVVSAASIEPIANHWIFAEEFVYQSGVFIKGIHKTFDSQMKIEASLDKGARIKPRIIEVDGRRFEFYGKVIHSSYAGLFDIPQSVVSTNDAERYAYHYLAHLKSDFQFTTVIIFFIALFPPLLLFLIGMTNRRP